jgi:hypothetical protein
MTLQDQAILALTIWRENRGGGIPGMQSVANVIYNRVAKRGTDVTTECLRKLQFSSMTAQGDPELSLGPNALDAAGWSTWLSALDLAGEAAANNLPDITGGATVYYAPKGISSTATITLPCGTFPFPMSWNKAAVKFTTEIAGQLFFVE